jgi:hypothetical protein
MRAETAIPPDIVTNSLESFRDARDRLVIGVRIRDKQCRHLG